MDKEINNNIEEAYCSFEVSQLLKEKGFDCLCHYHYSYGSGDKEANKNPQNLIYQGGFLDKFGSNRTYRNSELAKWELPFGEFSMPTHALAIEWLRVNFDIEFIQRVSYGKTKQYICDPVGHKLKTQNTPQEATETALLFTLKNLI